MVGTERDFEVTPWRNGDLIGSKKALKSFGANLDRKFKCAVFGAFFGNDFFPVEAKAFFLFVLEVFLEGHGLRRPKIGVFAHDVFKNKCFGLGVVDDGLVEICRIAEVKTLG